MDDDILRRRPGLRRVADWLAVEFAESKLRRPVVGFRRGIRQFRRTTTPSGRK